MRNGELNKLVSIAGRTLLAFLFVFSQGAWAAQNQGSKGKASSAQKAGAEQANEKQSAVPARTAAQSKQAQGEESESAVAEEKPSGDASHQGIKVHGHWTIEVRNPDGAMVRHVEFENSLTLAGAPVFPALLSRGAVPGGWTINLSGPVGGLCHSGGISNPVSTCLLAENSVALGPPDGFLTVGTSGSFSEKLTLSGSVMGVPSAGTITTVASGLVTCPATMTPSTCLTTPGFFNSFTAATPTGGVVSIAGGQVVSVTVVFSFS